MKEMEAVLAELRGVSHAYGSRRALQPVDFSLQEGEMLALMGESGSGKTTLLKILAGEIRPKKGQALLSLKGRDARIARKYGCLFQNGELIEWLKISVQFSLMLRFHGISGENAENRIMNALHMTEMNDCADAFPGQLSGGQYQRALLAKSLLLQPRLLIWDDPLCHTEAGQRRRIWQRLKEWQQRTGCTVVFTAGQREEALENASRILLLREGSVVQQGMPRQLISRPENHYAAAFPGRRNLLPVEVTGFGEKNAVLEMDGVALPCRDQRGMALGDRMALWIDWADMHYGLKPQGKIFLSGVLREFAWDAGGEMAEIQLPGGRTVRAYCHQGADCPAGSRVFLWWDIDKAILTHWDDSVQ